MMGRVKLMWKMPKNQSGSSTRAATMASSTCPNCRRGFKHASSVLKHMNHRFTSCHRWFADNELPLPAPVPLDADATSSYFPNAGHIFGSGSGFMGWFASDDNAEAQSIDPFYPFLSKDEWDIAEFLSCSGLSMKLIDQLLSLNSVSCCDSFEDI